MKTKRLITDYDCFIEVDEKLKKLIKQNRDELKSSLQKDISIELEQRGFTRFPTSQDHRFVYLMFNFAVTDIGQQNPPVIVSVEFEFTYVYNDHVHFEIGTRNADGKYTSLGKGTCQWYFRKQKLTDFIDKLAQVVELEMF